MNSARWPEIIARYELAVQWRGTQWRGPCPLHGGRNRLSFVITPEKGFHCFSCGAGGGIAQFIARMEGIPPAPRADRRDRPDTITRSAAPSAVPALTPLDPTHAYFRARGIHPATARYFGMGYFAGTPPLGGKIVVPLHDATGILVGHLGRAIDDTEPRYIFQRGVERHALLFNLHRVIARGDDVVVLVEGVFDAAAVHQVGIANVVASLSCRVTTEQRALLRRFRRVFILFDDDRAGEDASRELQAALGTAAARLGLPKADPCSIKGVLLEEIIRAAARADAPAIPSCPPLSYRS